MVETLNEFILQSVASPWLLPVLFAITLIDGFFPPVPSETVLVAAASVAVSTGSGNLLLLALVAAVGAMLGDSIAYALGRAIGATRFSWMRRPRVAAAFDRARDALSRRGAMFIIGGRYIPGGRIVVNMSAGALRYPWLKFASVDAVACLSWTAFSIAIGVFAGAWIKDQPLLSAGLGVAFALVIGLIIDRVAAARRARVSERAVDEPQHTPLAVSK